MKILLAIDDSKFSDAAIQMLIAQNQPGKTTVRVLHVVEPIEKPYYSELSPPYPRDFNGLKKKRLKAGRDLVAKTTDKLRTAGFKVDGGVNQGHPRTTIVDTAAKWHANLIVIGSHGRKGLGRLLLGSVSDYVARHASCSVQIVRTRALKKAK